MESNSSGGKDSSNPGSGATLSAAAGDQGDGRAEAAGKDRNGKRLVIITAIVIPLLVALIPAAANIYDTYISKNLAGASSGQQENSPGRIDASAFSSAPTSPSPTTDIPASTSKPSFDAHNPPVQCPYLQIESGQGIGVGCKQITGSAEVQYLAPNFLAGTSGRFVEAYPTGQGPSAFYNSCFQQFATPLTRFDTEGAAPGNSYFCYIQRHLVIFVRFMHPDNKTTVEIGLYEWFPS